MLPNCYQNDIFSSRREKALTAHGRLPSFAPPVSQTTVHPNIHMIKKKSLHSAFTLIELLVVITIIGILAGIALPVFNSVQIKGAQTKALAQAKQVGLALKLFATDNDGSYPGKNNPANFTSDPATSNDAFACLFPQYLTNEQIFSNKLVFGSKIADNVYDQTYNGTRTLTLAPGENVYAYMDNQTDSSNPNNPLVFDNCKGDGTYTNAANAVGSVWGGTKAVCIRLDNSGAVESLNTTSATAAFIKIIITGTTQVNALSTTANTNFSTANKLLVCDGLQ